MSSWIHQFYKKLQQYMNEMMLGKQYANCREDSNRV